VVVSHEARGLEPGTQSELPLKNRERAWAKRNSTIFSGLGLTSVDSGDPCLVDADDSVDEVEIGGCGLTCATVADGGQPIRPPCGIGTHRVSTGNIRKNIWLALRASYR
jgi:hypothetical protein